MLSGLLLCADPPAVLLHHCHSAALPSTAALSETVKDKPVGVDILGSRITLFRNETDQVVAVDDTWPHRGAPLSDGWTATDKTTGKK
jgi:nitrite reductase/ring-hydroxylating ferredoxin subunit